MKIGDVISALTFSESERERIAKLMQQSASCNKKIFCDYAPKTQIANNIKIPGQSKGRPAHIKAAVKKIIEGLEGTKKKKERFWEAYHSTIVCYLQNQQKEIQKLLEEVDYDNPEPSSEDLLRVICENAKKYKVTSEVVEELYELWGFERIKNIEDILALIENNDSSETEEEIEQSEEQEFPEGLPDHYNGNDTVKKRLKLFLNTTTKKIKQLFKSDFIKRFPKHRALRKESTLKGLHHLYSIPEFRRDVYKSILKNVCEKGESSLEKLVASSFEYKSFKKYKNIVPQAKFTEKSLKDIYEIDSKIKIYLNKKYEELDGDEIEDLNKIFQNHLLLWEDVKKDLKKWININEEQRKILINVIFSLGTLLNSIAPIKIAIKTVPEIKHYFSNLMLTYDKKFSAVGKSDDVIDADETSQDQSDEEITWKNSVRDLIELCQKISDEKPNKEHISKLVEITTNLVKKFPEEEEGGLDEIRNSLKEYKNDLIVFENEKNYSWLNLNIINQIFKKWKTYVSDVEEEEEYKRIIGEVQQSKEESFNQLKKYSEREQEKKELDSKIQEKGPDVSIEIEARQAIKSLRKELHAKEEILEEMQIEFIQQASPPEKTHIIHNSTRLEDSDLNSKKQEEEIPEQKPEPADSLEVKENLGMASEKGFNGEIDIEDEERLKTTKKQTKGKSPIFNSAVFGRAKILNFDVTGKQATEGFLNGGDNDKTEQGNVFWYMVRQGKLNYAYWFVKSLEESKKSKIVISSNLIKAIALADKVFDPLEEADSLYKKNLVDINETDIRNLIAGDLVFKGSRYLVFSGFLQPSFVGNLHPNLELMKLSNKNLPEVVSDCFKSCFNFVQQKKRNFSFSQFEATGKSGKELKEEIKSELSEFVDACEDRSGRSWQENIFVRELIKGEFKPLIEIMRKDSRERQHEVQKIVDKYPNRDSLVDLLKSNYQIKKTDRNNPHHTYDYRKAHRENAVSKCQKLLKLAKRWISIGTSKAKSQNDKDQIRDFSSKFNNYYSKVRKELIQLRDAHKDDLVPYSCINLCIEYVSKLSEAINGKYQSLGFDINDWFELPQRLESSENNTPASSLALRLASITSKDFNLEEALKNSISDGDFAVAEVLLREQSKAGSLRKELNEIKSNVRKKRDDFKKKLESEVEVIKSLVDDAYEHSIIDEVSRSSFYSKIDGAREMGDEENPRYPESNELLKNIKNIIGSKKENALKDWGEKFKKLSEESNAREDFKNRRLEIEKYEESIKNAFEEKNITVISEKLISYEEFLKDPNQPLYDSEKSRLAEFEEFFNKQDNIFSECKNLNQNQIKDYIHHDKFKSLDFSDQKKPTNEIRAWTGLASTSISKNLDAGQKKQVCQILNGLGLSDISPDSIEDGSFGQKINLIKAKVKISSGESPFPIFGSKSKGQYHLVISQKNSYSEIHSFLEDKSILSEKLPIIVFVMDDFDLTSRSRFTEYCLKKKLSIIVVDRIIFLFVLSLANDPNESRLKKFFKVTLPFTYNNPYQISLSPPDSEMVFGREDEIKGLISFPGDAIIFGGRQLGKSTLLQEAEARFDNPENGFYAMRGPSLRHYRNKDLKYIRSDFWKKMGETFYSKGFLETKESYRFEDIVNFLKERKDLRILFSFDEVDAFLIEDDKYGFPICADLKQMTLDTGGRFKVVMAGLLSVQRFSERPNVPLAQLGGIRNIGMLDKKDAMDLIQSPSAFAGYTYDDASVNTILAYTNRHPGLIQVFCFHLLEYLREQRIKRPVASKSKLNPGYKITQEDIYAIRRKREISETIKNRFVITISLNDHWKVIIYAVIVEGLELGFDASQAKKSAEYWWKEGFSGKDPALVRIFLDEMVGLGVLSRKEGKDKIYSLRSPNIRPHLGSRKEIEETLIHFKPQTLEHQKYNHRLSQSGHVSPFEESHELVITGHKNIKSSFEQGNEDRFSSFTITGIFGSDALGFEELKNSFSTLSEFEGSKDYTVLEYSKVDSLGSKECLKWIKQKIRENAQNKSIVLMIHMPIMPESEKLYLDLLSEAERSFAKKSFKNNIRLVFLFNPEAIWNWLGLENYRELEEKISFITLKRFSEEAVETLLRDWKLLFSEEYKNFVMRRTEGWFELIKKFSEVKNKSGGGDDPTLLKGLDNKVPETPQLGGAINFLKKQGLSLDRLSFAIPLLSSIIENSDIIGDEIKIRSDLFDECVEIYNMENDEEKLDPVRVREWYFRIGILKIKSEERNKNNDILYVDKRTKVCIEVSETS